MEALSQSRRNSHGFRSRRSHGSLQHISLAPLSSRFPLDDDDVDVDYFSSSHAAGPSSQLGENAYQPRLPTGSYLSSKSVPSTPPLLSTSRNVSQTNLAKKRRTAGGIPISDTRLDILDSQGPLHHQRTRSHTPRSAATFDTSRTRRQDNEWLMRAGQALSSTTREEKGQSWLVKRESSTSLVSDANQDEERSRNSRYRHDKSRPRSGLSTPMARSRRGSNSFPASRRTSRIDLSMTPSYSPARPNFNGIPRSGGISEDGDLVPDFVDESIRAEFHSGNSNHSTSSVNYAMYPSQSGTASPRARGSELNSSRSSVFGQQISPSESDYFSESDDEEDEGVEEAEMQRLTRERGFGLGSWVDRLVAWTLFGAESESAEAPGAAGQFGGLHSGHVEDDNIRSSQQTVVNFQSESQADSEIPISERSDSSDAETEGSYSTETESGCNEARDVKSAPQDDKGRWADMKWLLHVARNSVL